MSVGGKLLDVVQPFGPAHDAAHHGADSSRSKCNGAHGHANEGMTDAARLHAEDERIVHPFMLDMFLLPSIRHRHGNRIVARRKQRQIELEARPRGVACFKSERLVL